MVEVEELRQKGNEFYKTKDYEAAIRCYDQVLEQDEGVVLALGNRCAAHLALERWEEAETDARAALELDFGNEKYLFRLCSSLLGQSESSEGSTSTSEPKIRECSKLVEDSILLHPESSALKTLKLKVMKQRKLVEERTGDKKAEMGSSNAKKSRNGRGFFNTQAANDVGIFGVDGGMGGDMYCLPCEDDGSSGGGSAGLANPFAVDGALIIETIPGASYSDVEYSMLNHIKDIVKSIQRGGLSSAGLLQNHFLTGKFKQLCDKECFARTLFPGFSKEALESMPQNIRELLLWKELTLDLTKIARSAANVLTAVKEKGQKSGDIMDKESETMLTPQIAQEALALELESAVRKVGKQVSKVLAKVQLSLASPGTEQAQWDQLDDDVWPEVLQFPRKLCVQEEYLGADWAALVLQDAVRFAGKEPMDDVPMPGEKGSGRDSSSSGGTTDISTAPSATDVEINLPAVPARMAWLESNYAAYPALSEAISKLQGLPFELNLKQGSAMALKEPARGCVSLVHHPAFSEQPERLDNSAGKNDSGIRLSCYYYLIPPQTQGREGGVRLVHRVSPSDGEPGGREENDADADADGGNGDTAAAGEVLLESDSLVLLQSTKVMHSRMCTQFEYYVLCVYVHGQSE